LAARFAGHTPRQAPRNPALPAAGAHRHGIAMFVLTEADAAAICAAFDQEGELSAATELRRRFPGITDNAKALAYARTIGGWTPLAAQCRTASPS
jgi:hypothetical protein